jgi:hypothetical protein
MQIRSRLATITITAALAAGILTALGAAVPASAAARAQLTPNTSDPYTFQSVGNGEDYINGDAHGEDLYLAAGYTLYELYPKGNGWYAISPGPGLCWNALPKATSPVGIDSCQSTDHNEWFGFYDSNGYCAIRQDSSSLWITAVDYKVDLDAIGGPAANQEWFENGVGCP